jgi:broad specificity phosphatase PhoE
MAATVWWVRHGESEANAGLPTPDAWTTPLTQEGWRQSHAIAAAIRQRPRLIVHSCMTRAKQTCEPTLARWPLTPTEQWPVQEFTFLSGPRYVNTTQEERQAGVRGYWERMDPHEVDGLGAESFAAFIGRVDAALARLAAIDQSPTDGPVVVFTHGRFLRGVLLRIRECAAGQPPIPLDQLMRRARDLMTEVSVPNGVIIPMRRLAAAGDLPGAAWTLGCPEIGHLIEDEDAAPLPAAVA